MKKIFFLTLLLISTLFCIKAYGFCSLYLVDHVTRCVEDEEGKCCLVEYEKNNLKCSEIWCYSRSDCEWELSSAQVCK